ncbi:ABC transporter permease [Ornithinimicrobium cavernae]|uniref:ABC transporter permease n=1 Tax=Ornithinimicrobium cavernae TaxID=2666047 RepID=UPI000D68E9A6|nr:ABC transporter permease subunit [Ornithinimicrobium cavernae]
MLPDLHIGEGAAATVRWLQTNATVIFDAIAWVMTVLIDTVLFVLTAPHALVITVAATVLALWARGIGFAVFTLLGMLIVDSMGLWGATMATLAIVIVAAFLAVLVGVPTGILAARTYAASATIRPVLDFMQTLPVFVYLIPAVFFFGIGVVPATVATFIFAIPPAVRLTELGLRQVDPEMVEASLAFGANRNQLLRQVQLPLAVPSIMAGVNQVIMMALSMVVIAGMVGAGGLGAVVVEGISRLQVSTGFEGGIGVVFLAILLDRLTSAFPLDRHSDPADGDDEDEGDDDQAADPPTVVGQAPVH